MAYTYRKNSTRATQAAGEPIEVWTEEESIALIRKLRELDKAFMDTLGTTKPPRAKIAQCGTVGGYQRHTRLRTPKCQACKDAKRAARFRLKVQEQCFTYAGYMRHKRAGEQACELCRRAYATYMRDYRERKVAA